MFDQLIHRWLRIPYTLHTQVTQRAKPRVTVMFIHGIGNSGKVWADVIHRLPKDVRCVTVDLLGFGESPKPSWAVYNARTQARSVLATYVKLRLFGPVILVANSLVSLVAVEEARRNRFLVKAFVLVSPPFYHLDSEERRLLPRPEKVLRFLYKFIQKHPDEFMNIAELAMRYKLISGAFEVDRDGVGSYMATLEAAIVNQTAILDVQKLNQPIRIIHGMVDPVVVASNLTFLEKTRPNISLRHVAAGHELTGFMNPAVCKAIEALRSTM